MWNELTIRSPLRDKRKFCSIMSNEQNPNVCDEPIGEEAARLRDLDHMFKHKVGFQTFIYDDRTLTGALGFKWSHYQDCYRITHLMSSTVESRDKLESLVKIFADKLKWFMKKEKTSKICILPIWGHKNEKQDMLGNEGSIRKRDVPYIARMYQAFWSILEDGLREEGIIFEDDEKQNMWFLYLRE